MGHPRTRTLGTLKIVHHIGCGTAQLFINFSWSAVPRGDDFVTSHNILVYLTPVCTTGPTPPLCARQLGTLLGLVGQTISPKFLLLLNPVITEPSGNNLLLTGSLKSVYLFFLRMFEMSGFRGSQSDTNTNFLFAGSCLLFLGLKIIFSQFFLASP